MLIGTGSSSFNSESNYTAVECSVCVYIVWHLNYSGHCVKRLKMGRPLAAGSLLTRAAAVIEMKDLVESQKTTRALMQQNPGNRRSHCLLTSSQWLF